MLECKSCGAALDVTMAACPACGAEVPMGRLTGILGLVCRKCDAYNEPGARTCVSCGEPLGITVEVGPPPAPPAGSGPAVQASTGTGIPAGSGTAVPAAPPASPAPAPQPFGRWSPAPRPGPAGPPPSAAPPAALCPGCGSEVGTGPFCPNCGRPVAASGAFLQPPGGASTSARAAPPASAPLAGTAMFTAQGALPARARLLLERGEAAAGSVFQLSGEEVQAGRSQGAVIFPSDPCLAPHHVTFLQREGGLSVRDEGGPGGVFVRIPRGQTVPLRPGGLFAIGDRLLRFASVLPPPPPPPPDGTLRLGAPRLEPHAVLLEEWLEGGISGRVWLRAGPSITVGRAGCAVSLGDDPYLSQAHAEVVVEADGSASLRDLGSSNGTFVRVPPGGEVPLRDGDELRMGREVLRVEIR